PSEKDKIETEICTILAFEEGKILVFRERKEYKIEQKDIKGKFLRYVGANPFSNDSDSVRCIAYSLESILFNLNVLGEKEEKYYTKGVEVLIKNLNWNPFVYDKEGNKQYYQRDFVWSLQDKQNLIDSIYNGIDCGKIVVRARSWKDLDVIAAKGETEVAFHDIVDGKQCLNAIAGFIKGEYPDSYGNYFADLSADAQHNFTNNQLISYGEMPESSTDEQVIKQFLKMNFTGVLQSKEHIAYVKSINEKMK
ncbi:MAG: DUF262 domain-containing protein, partial [Candidatus Omnitrophica bacterium]|nr:DUF262 domain-containing protein [Candidatus Omnitrophota bacterium]